MTRGGDAMTLQWWLQGLYLFTAIFGISVTVADMLGILGAGDDHGAGDHGDHGAAVHGDAQDGAHPPLLSILGYLRGVNAANGITVGADATACVCVDDEDETLLYSAVERLMGKSRDEIREQIQQTMIGNVRGALNKTTPLGMLESVEDPDKPMDTHPSAGAEGECAQFPWELLTDSNQDLSSFGMCVVSVSLQKTWDTSSYIANLTNKTLSRKRQEVEIEEARLRARAERAESDAQQREIVAENQANEQKRSERGARPGTGSHRPAHTYGEDFAAGGHRRAPGLPHRKF
jgi:hypothetical protein